MTDPCVLWWCALFFRRDMGRQKHKQIDDEKRENLPGNTPLPPRLTSCVVERKR